MAQHIKNTEIQFINTTPDVIRAMRNLSKKALRKSGKVVKQILIDNTPAFRSRLKNHVNVSVNVSRDGRPQCKIGFLSHQRVSKQGKKPSSASPHWIEFGVSPHAISAKGGGMGYGSGAGGVFFGKSINHPGMKGTHVLRDSVYNNIDAIQAAQAELLAELSSMTDAAVAGLPDDPDDPDD